MAVLYSDTKEISLVVRKQTKKAGKNETRTQAWMILSGTMASRSTARKIRNEKVLDEATTIIPLHLRENPDGEKKTATT